MVAPPPPYRDTYRLVLMVGGITLSGHMSIGRSTSFAIPFSGLGSIWLKEKVSPSKDGCKTLQSWHRVQFDSMRVM